MSRPTVDRVLADALARALGPERAAELLGADVPGVEHPPNAGDVLFLRLLASELEQKGRLSEPGRTASNLWHLAARLERWMGPA